MEDDHKATNDEENSTVYGWRPYTNPNFEQNAHENGFQSTLDVGKDPSDIILHWSISSVKMKSHSLSV